MSMPSEYHLTDQQLLLEMEGELAASEQALVRSHLTDCWRCRARRQDFETAIRDFARVHEREFEGKLPPVAGPRALLRARLDRMMPEEADGGASAPRGGALVWASLAIALAAAILLLAHSGRREAMPPKAAVVFLPDAKLTPGAVTLANRQAVCAAANVKNRAVSTVVRRQVFTEYGIATSAPEEYEVDYLVTPALGGADDLRNLWPHSYATIWNARVKDDLEDRLRDMVCDGSLELAEAQREIAGNWISAYKKYFHTEQPMVAR